MKKLVIIGAGGFAREVLDVINAGGSEPFAGWIVERQFAQEDVRGAPVLGDIDWLIEHRDEYEAICGIGDPGVRRRLAEQAERGGVRFSWVTHPNYVAGEPVEPGPGSVLCANVVLTNNVRIGRHVHLNLATTVGHDAVIGDFVTTAPGVHISGNVTIGEGAYLGTGAVVLEKLTIGPGAIIGAGAVVTKDVPPGITVVGIPARPLN